MIKGGDFSMLKVWAGLEARSWLQASVEAVRNPRSASSFALELFVVANFIAQVERCVKYDLLSPNV
jgi:aarF domain-containing kinase